VKARRSGVEGEGAGGVDEDVKQGGGARASSRRGRRLCWWLDHRGPPGTRHPVFAGTTREIGSARGLITYWKGMSE
jgi:hypothetical protein